MPTVFHYPHTALLQSRFLLLPDAALRNNSATASARIAAFTGLDPFAHVATSVGRAEGLDGPWRWIDLPAALVIAFLEREWGAFAKTGWRLTGSYAPMAPDLQIYLSEFFAPYNEALARLLGCDIFAFTW